MINFDNHIYFSHNLVKQLNIEVFGFTKKGIYKLNNIFKNSNSNLLKERILIIAITFFAITDSCVALGKAIFKGVILKKDEAALEINKCRSATRFFFISCYYLPTALKNPKVYQTYDNWPSVEDKLQKELEKNIAENTKHYSLKDSCLKAFQKAHQSIMGYHIEKLHSIELHLIDHIPTNEGQKIAIREYTHFYAKFLMGIFLKAIPLEKLDDNEIQIIKAIIELHQPELRIKLLNTFSKTLKNNPEIFKMISTFQFSSSIKEEKFNSYLLKIFAYLILNLTENEKLRANLMTIATSSILKDKLKMGYFINVLACMANHSLSTDIKEELLQKLVVQFAEIDATKKGNSKPSIAKIQKTIQVQKDLFKEKENRIQNLQNQPEKAKQVEQIKEAAKKIKDKIAQLESSLDNYSDKENGIGSGDISKVIEKPVVNDRLKQALEKLNQQLNLKEKEYEQLISKNVDTQHTLILEKEIKKIKFRIANLEIQMHKEKCPLSEKSKIQVSLEKIEHIEEHSGSFLHTLEILNTLLTMQDPQKLEIILKNYEKLDNKIIFDLFQMVFAMDEKTDFSEILKMRAPNAFIELHLRLNELKGDERSNAEKGIKKLLLSIINGDYENERHREDMNIHLKKIFTARPGLKEKWMKAPKFKLNELISSANQFSHYEISDTNNPCDILLLGNELNSCMALNRRIQCVKGLLAFAMDGKIHSIIIKNNEGKICAETQLYLMWDEINQKPVLYLGLINYQRTPPFLKGIQAYAKKRAEELELDLVTCYDGAHFIQNAKNAKHKGKYPGNVKSLGSPFQIEYIDVTHKSSKGIYTLPQTYHIF